jgi:ABC-type uncharacterized transport system substrate-binding protein
MTRGTRAIVYVLGVVGLFGLPVAGWAHPHVFIDGRTEIVFDAQGRIAAIRNIWQFDEAFSSYASLGLDVNGDGKLTREELVPLAKVNVESLHEYDFFTYLTVGTDNVRFSPPVDYYLVDENKRLTLHYTLPLAKPIAVVGETTLEIFDPEYFVAFSFSGKAAVKLVHAPRGCSIAYHPPHELDDQIMAALNAIPAEQHDLPPALADAAVGLAPSFTLTCPR